MTVQEAIHCMKFVTEEEVCEECHIYGETGTDHCFADAHRLAIETLEKQIPKKHNIHEGFMTVARCPVCNEITAFKNEYCSGCGQKLDWSKRDD